MFNQDEMDTFFYDLQKYSDHILFLALERDEF